MRLDKAVAVSLCVLVLVLGLLLLGRADPPNTPPNLTTFGPAVAGQAIGGSAIDAQPGDVVVKAYIDGQELQDSPDTEMEGIENIFEFEIPPGTTGKVLEIRAIDADGMTEKMFLPIE